MYAFEYVSVDESGKRHKGVVEADNPRIAKQILRERRLSLIELNESSAGYKSKTLRKAKTRIRLRDASIFTRQLAALVESGLPVEEALLALGRQELNAKKRAMITTLRSQLLEGKSLSEALTAFPYVFSDMYRHSIYAGERTGHLAKVLQYLADYMEKSVQGRQKVLLALLYPAILIAVALLIIIFLVSYVVPGMTKIFAGTGHELPALTTAVIGFSNIISSYGLIMLGVLLAVALAIKQLMKQQALRLKSDRYLLSVPLIGSIMLEYEMARFASTLGMLQESSVPLVQALEIVTATIKNRHLRAQVDTVKTKVGEGMSLSRALSQESGFSSVLITMTASGEASGKLGHMLSRAGAIIQRDVENRIALLLGLFEPAVLLLMGGIVLLLVLAIILPILQLNQMV